MDYDYSEDPFAGDDDDLCYAEIIIPSDANTPSQPRTGGRQRASVPRHTDPYAYSTPNADEVLRGVGARDNSELGTHASTYQPQSQYAPSSQRVPSRSGSVRGSVAAADPDEIAATYEDMLQGLRNEVDRLQEENNSLYSTQSKLESQLRKMTLDKEDMEWRLQQAQERNALLEERIDAMGQDLAYAHEERREQRELGARRARAESTATTATATTTTAITAPAAPARSNARGAAPPLPPSSQKVPPSQPQPQQNTTAPAVSAAPTAGAQEADAAPQAPQRVRAKPTPPPFATSADTTAPPPKRTAAQTANLTQKQKDHDYQTSMQSVEKLEAELLEHCQKRDELMGTIQRLEGGRVRTIADRAKKAAAESDLEEEDRVIGRIRLQLRSQASLHK